MLATVLLADLKGSRKIEDRPLAARKLRELLAQINREHAEVFVAPLQIEKGIDEFAAILQPKQDPTRVLLELWDGVHPWAIRIALIRGQLDVIPRAGARDVRRFDGPAFHVANRAMAEMDPKERLVAISVTGNDETDAQVTLLANLLYYRWLEWTPRQLEMFQGYRRWGLQERVARALKITQPTVSQALSRVHAVFMKKAIDEFQKTMITGIGGRGHSRRPS